MPSLANITVKKNDGTTDILWSGVAASAGDKSPAEWRSLTVGSAPAFQPTMKMVALDNGPKTARRVNVETTYPYTTTGTDGKTYLAEKVVMTCSIVLPNGMPTTDSNEAVAQAMNLLASSLVKACMQAGFSAT
jgi:hypothetical protein